MGDIAVKEEVPPGASVHMVGVRGIVIISTMSAASKISRVGYDSPAVAVEREDGVVRLTHSADDNAAFEIEVQAGTVVVIEDAEGAVSIATSDDKKGFLKDRKPGGVIIGLKRFRGGFTYTTV